MNRYNKTPTSRRRMLRGFAAGAAICLLGANAVAADNFPNRVITLVSPYQAGGGADSIGRAIAEAAAKQLGQPVVVESKPGAEGIIGAMDIIRSKPDGYRLFWGGGGSMVVSPALRKKTPFDPVKAFTPISGSVDFSFFLYVRPDFPANNFKEFIAEVKANPGKYNYGTGNNTGLLTFAYLKKKYGLDIQQVKYKGESAVVNDLIPGRVQALFATTSALQHAKTGKLKMLVTTLPERSELAPDVPTFQESGFEEIPFSPAGGWLGIFGPPGMDPGIQTKLHEAFDKALQDPEVKKMILSGGLKHTPMSIPELTEFVRSQRDQYIETVRDLQIPQID